jgi:DNA-binding transcriptional ArsR family regulator
VLKEAELVMAEREGQHVRYRLNTTVFQETVRYFIDKLSGGAHA